MKRVGMPLSTETRVTYTEVSPPGRLAYKTLADFVPDVTPYKVELRRIARLDYGPWFGTIFGVEQAAGNGGFDEVFWQFKFDDAHAVAATLAMPTDAQCTWADSVMLGRTLDRRSHRVNATPFRAPRLRRFRLETLVRGDIEGDITSSNNELFPLFASCQRSQERRGGPGNSLKAYVPPAHAVPQPFAARRRSSWTS